MLERTGPSSPTRRRFLATALAAGLLVLLALQRPEAADSVSAWASEGAATLAARARNVLLGPPRVGIQIGHLDAAAHPEELANLRVSTGAHAGGVDEVDVNRAVAEALAERLERRGIRTELLPATVPRGYRADLVVSLHADSNLDEGRRGYKSAHFRHERNPRDAELARFIDEAYLAGSGMPHDESNISGDMLEYYAFNRRFRHSLHRRTPAVIVEMGYLSNPRDRAFMLEPQRPAALLEEGIVAALRTWRRLEER